MRDLVMHGTAKGYKFEIIFRIIRLFLVIFMILLALKGSLCIRSVRFVCVNI